MERDTQICDNCEKFVEKTVPVGHAVLCLSCYKKWQEETKRLNKGVLKLVKPRRSKK